MAINLNPGADATLVTAATRAGLATAPADYSKTFQRVADSYEKTMEAQAEMWGDIGKVVSIVGADMVANAQEFMDYRIKGGALNPDSAKFLVNELEQNKEAQKDLGLFGGILGNQETRQRKRELKIEQAELFAEIDMAAQSINAGAEAVAAGLFDHELATNDGEIINAIIKSNLKDKITEAGNQAVLSRDEKTDELIFTLLDRDGNPVLNAANEPTTMSIKEFNKSITTNVKDTKNVMSGALNTLNDNTANSGAKSTNGVYDPQMKQAALNQLDSILNTDTDLKRAMMTTFGYSNTSFADDIKNPGTFSANLYSSLLQSIGKTKGGQVKAEGVLEGIADTDGVLGLSQDEISNNYAILSANILGMKDPEVSKAYFKEYTVNKLKEAYEYGYSKKPPTPKGSAISKNPFKSKIAFYPEGGGTVQYKTPTEALAHRDAILNGQPFQGIYGNYSKGKDGGYMLNGEPISQYDALVLEKVSIAGDKADQLGGSSFGDETPSQSAYSIDVIDLDDKALKKKIITDYGFTVNKDIEGVYDAGVEVIEIVAPNGARQVIYLQGEKGSSKEAELEKLNKFIRENYDPLNPNN